MPCLITFDNTPSTGVISGAASNNGVWEYLGYSTTEGGTYGAGGNFPSVTTWGQSVDISGVFPGFYKFKYKSALPPADPCYGEAEFIIPIVQGTTDVGPNVVIDLCSNDPIRNIFDDSGLFDPTATLGVTQAIGGAGISSPGYSNQGTSGDVTDDTYDPSLEASYPVTRIFQFTYTPADPPGYNQSGCTNCDAKSMTVTYNVTEAFNPGNPSTISACNDGDV